MKVIIAGSRDIVSYPIVTSAVHQSGFEITEVVSGGARGADRLGEAYAKNNDIALKVMPADWNKFGKSAGYRRNEEMARYADALIALWDGESRGTMHMIEIAKRLNMPIFIFNTKEQ